MTWPDPSAGQPNGHGDNPNEPSQVPDPGAPTLPPRPVQQSPTSPPASTPLAQQPVTSLEPVSRLGTEASRSAIRRVRRRNTARSVTLALLAGAVVMGGVLGVRSLYLADQRRDDERRAEIAAQPEGSLEDIIDILERAAEMAPSTTAPPLSPGRMFGPIADEALTTADLVTQLVPATVVGAPDLPQYRTRQFTLRHFADGSTDVLTDWNFNYDTQVDTYFAAEIIPPSPTAFRWLSLEPSWQYTYIAGQPMLRVPRRPGAPAINPNAAYRPEMDLAAVISPAVEAFAYQVPIPADVVDDSLGGEPIGYLVDLASLRAADPAIADAWLASWGIVDVDDPGLIDDSSRATKPDPGIQIFGSVHQWRVDVSQLHPPDDAALVIAVVFVNGVVGELTIAAPGDDLWFQYASIGGFDSPMVPSIGFIPDGWTPS